ncbi:MAG TPA: YheU family protein [Steroidobacteraceae bacterium]|nr:YheU family protein [Steroidobacteraceae bacterium]
MVVPHGALSADALRGVIESFVLREGTDYGELEHSLEAKVAQVRAQLERGQARILFDPESNTVTLEVVPAAPRGARRP